MKILQLVHSRQYRGAEVSAATLSEDLSALGHEVLFVGIKAPGKPALTPEGCRLIDLGAEGRWATGKAVRALYRLLVKEKPDLIQCNGSITLKVAVLAGVFFPKTTVVYRNISKISTWMVGPWRKLAYRLLFSRVKQVVSVSQASEADFKQTFPSLAERVTVIRRGVGEFSVHREQDLGIPSGRQILLHVGQFSKEKNHAGLLRIFAAVLRKVPDVHLVCVGEGPLLSQTILLAKSLGIFSRLSLVGSQKEVSPFYATAKLLLLPSHIEGIPGVVMEAGQHGVPSVAYDVGGVSELVEDGVSGKLIAPGDEATFAEAVATLLNYPKLKQDMGEAICEVVRKEHNREKQALAFENLFRTYGRSEMRKNSP